MLNSRVCNPSCNVHSCSYNNYACELIFVNPAVDSILGSGTINDPYGLFSLGLAKIVTNYATVFLMKGEHNLTTFDTNLSLYSKTFNRPLSRTSNRPLSVYIKPLYCDEFDIPNLCLEKDEKITISVQILPDTPIALDV